MDGLGERRQLAGLAAPGEGLVQGIVRVLLAAALFELGGKYRAATGSWPGNAGRATSFSVLISGNFTMLEGKFATTSSPK